jgi:hypothetical protein
MTTFDKREEAFEKKFAHDEEMRFKLVARRNRMFGEWVAERLGKTGDAVKEYATSVVLADFEEAGDEDVLRKVRTDLERAGVAATDADLRARLAACEAAAVEALK